jgi:hypothetical protein
MLDRMLGVVRGLTYTNVAIMALLLLIAFPAYFGYRMLNDQALMGAVFNVYSELDAPTDCLLSFQQPAGGTGSYVIRAVMAERAAEVWYVSAKVKFKPDDAAMAAYCNSASAVIEFLHDPNNAPLPVFPGSERKMVPFPRPIDPPRGGP